MGLTSLSGLFLNNNNLSGGLPKGVFSPLTHYIHTLDLSNNGLTQHEKKLIKAEFEGKASAWKNRDLKF